jgi:RNA 3'-terminal phosphate cyclase (ATP)
MEVLTLNGSYGEGGGQILRTALSLSAVTMQPFYLTNIRVGRRNPGILPQHLSAVTAAARITGAAVSGDRLGSAELSFSPTHLSKSGSYIFDVAETAERGSAGSVSLILQTLLVPLAFTDRASTLVLRGGTHVEWSPSFDDLVNAYFPTLRRMGFRINAELTRWGWYPVGNGEIWCEIGIDRRPAQLSPIQMTERGSLREIAGTAVAANLPAQSA